MVEFRAERPQRQQRPPSLFGGLPVSEFMILVGIVSLVIGFARGPSSGAAAIVTGVVLCTLAVVEFTAREHFRGYRSHSLLLALLTTIALHTGIGLARGEPAARSPLLVVVDAAVFVSLAVVLHRGFKRARAGGARRARR